MDLANNREGLLAFERLRKQGHLGLSEIEKEAMKALNEGKLVVITPRGK